MLRSDTTHLELQLGKVPVGLGSMSTPLVTSNIAVQDSPLIILGHELILIINLWTKLQLWYYVNFLQCCMLCSLKLGVLLNPGMVGQTSSRDLIHMVYLFHTHIRCGWHPKKYSGQCPGRSEASSVAVRSLTPKQDYLFNLPKNNKYDFSCCLECPFFWIKF